MLDLYIALQNTGSIHIEANNFKDTLAAHKVKSIYYKNTHNVTRELYADTLSKEMLDLAENLTAIAILTRDAIKAENQAEFNRIEINKHVNILTVVVVNTDIKIEMIVTPHNKRTNMEISENLKRVLFKLFKAMRKFEIVSQQ